MPNYKAMYLALFNAVTDSIFILQSAQCQTEEIALQEENKPLTVLPKSDEEEK